MRKHIYLLYTCLLAFFYQASAQNILSESFEGTFPPTGWTLVNAGAGNSWEQFSSAIYSYQGTKTMGYSYSPSDPANAWAFTPALALNSAKGYYITFYVSAPDPNYPESLKFTVGNAATVASQTTTLLDSSNVINTAYRKWTAYYQPAASGSFNFAFNCYSLADQDVLFVDSVSIFEGNPIASCSGTPTGGSAVTSASSVCSSASFNLTVTGSSTAQGLTYQWQSSPAGSNNWIDIGGATGANLVATTTANTDYRRRTICASSAISVNSSPVTITIISVPSNDLVCSAIPLSLNGPSNCGNTACATAIGDPTFSNNIPNNTVWYTFTPTTTGNVEFRFKRPAGVTSGLLNGWLAIYTVTGTCPFTFTEVPTYIHYDLTTSDTVLALSPLLTAGTQYYLMVDGSNGASGAFCIQVKTASPPVNDNCVSAVALAPGSTLFGTTLGASQSLPPSRCSGSDATSTRAYDVWYSIKALSNGTFTISVTGDASFDAVLGIYRGTCSALTLDTCRDATFNGGTESITVINAIAGTNYLIRVYSYYNTTDSVSSFTISTSGTSLPVTGLVLSGTRNGSKAQLTWQTLTEKNNAGFELQRSADGKYFTGISQIASKANGGNSIAAITYSAEDAKPLSGANYYRLKQTDKDGKISYSNIVYLKGAAVSTLTLSAVYPNPTNDLLKVAIQTPATENIEFVVTDMMGKTISHQVSTVVSGDNTININVANLPAGSYLLKAICRNGCETAYQKFTKQ